MLCILEITYLQILLNLTKILLNQVKQNLIKILCMIYSNGNSNAVLYWFKILFVG